MEGATLVPSIISSHDAVMHCPVDRIQSNRMRSLLLPAESYGPPHSAQTRTPRSSHPTTGYIRGTSTKKWRTHASVKAGAKRKREGEPVE